MRVALIMDLSGKGDDLLARYAREFVHQNTLLIDRAELHEVVERDPVREAGSNVGHLVLAGKPTRIL